MVGSWSVVEETGRHRVGSVEFARNEDFLEPSALIKET
jgi:hypothetical protein